MPLITGLKNLLSGNKSSSPNNNNSTTSPNSKSTSNNLNHSNSVSKRKSKDKNSLTVVESIPSIPTLTIPSPVTNSPATTTPTSVMASGNKEQAEALVRRENEARQKRDQATYAGLPPGLVLGVKMGDGAFSNVFMATLTPTSAQLAIDPTLGNSMKVAVKCVRKYELSYSQVSTILFILLSSYLSFAFPLLYKDFIISICAFMTNRQEPRNSIIFI